MVYLFYNILGEEIIEILEPLFMFFPPVRNLERSPEFMCNLNQCYGKADEMECQVGPLNEVREGVSV